jgi:preprotein translocase subunit SecA
MVLQKLLRLGEGRKAKELQKIVDAVNERSAEMQALSDDELKAKTGEFRERLEQGATLEDLQVEAFAVVREAAWRALHQRPYDVQVFGGAALHDGNIAEMKTGEGKTLTSTMPVYLNALAGKGVHVVTVNEYLAKRDAEWMGRIHRWLGLTVGAVHSQQTKDSKRVAYDSDITYGTTNEFGFDYLRDNMAWNKESQVQLQRGHYFALLDEVDSILIDEARTPLIISGPAEQSAQWYQIFARRVAPNLKRGEEDRKPGGVIVQTDDYVVDEAKRNVAITEQGVAKVEQLLGMDNLYESVNTPLIQHLNNALKAKELFKRDREYIVADGEVKIVDEQTGRVLEGRRYSEGLHQAIEAKEGVKVKDENQTLATITLQNYYRIYDKLAGMTGTAKTEEVEFAEIYELGVVEVPTNRPMIRDDKPDQIYKNERAKFDAVVREIANRNEAGQPVLVGTVDVAKSEYLSGLLKKQGIRHEVLNAKNHAREAHIVAQAGRQGAVTVSTNMAGRGTDIILGGNHEEMAKDEVAKLDPETPDEEKTRVYTEALERYERETEDQRQEVLAAGGLFVIGTERHESRRIDNQLRGRSGRQGDPGASRFFLSLEDDLMRLFNASAVDRIMTRLNIPEEEPIEHKLVTRAVANAQRQVESRNFDIRKNVLKYDDVLNEQRKVVYGQRQRIINGDHDEIDELAQKYMEDAIDDLVRMFAPEGVFPEEWDLAGLRTELEKIFDTSFDPAELDLDTLDSDALVEHVMTDALAAYEQREEEVGGHAVMREVERRVILSVIDRKWREHLYEMDALRDGIGLRAVGQRDPLVEYQREAYANFSAMMSSVKEEAVTYFFRLPVNREGGADTTQAQQSGGVSLDASSAARAATSEQGKVVADATPASGNGQTTTTEDEEAEAKAAALVDAPKEPSKLSYSSAATGAPATGAGGGGGGGATETREDGTTVRQVAVGGTYTKKDEEFGDVGRNDPCPCGSGKKFKKCHGA